MRLKTKILLALAPLCLATAALVVLLAGNATRRILTDELAQRVLGREAGTDDALAAAMSAGRETDVLPHLQRLADRSRAAYAGALSPSGVVVAHTNVVETGRRHDAALARGHLARSAPVAEIAGTGDRAVLEVYVPLWIRDAEFLLSSGGGDRRVGTLLVGLPLDGVRLTERRILRRLALVTGAAGAAALLAVVLLLNRLFQPIHPLMAAAAEIGRGVHGVKVPVLSADELGDLAASFNRMSADLASTTVSKGYLDDILNGMLDALIVLDESGRVRMANAAAARLLGRTGEELASLGIGALVAGGDAAATGARNAEVSLLGASGQRIPALLSSSAVSGPDGRPAGVVLVARDIRDRKAMESRMAQSEKLSAIGQLAAGVAHEINNPLGVMLGFAQTVCRRIDPGSEFELPLRSIEREALRCKELVQNLLAFSRQDRKVQGPLDLITAVSNALSLVEAQARVRGVQIRRELGDGPFVIDGNSNQLQQIVINLCGNAIDATPSGGSVTVSCAPVSREDGAWTRLTVRDTGSGIPPEIRKKIFDPFFTTKEPGKGTGLGLSLVFELVQHHRGVLDFTSQPGSGTTFTIDFPLASQDSRTSSLPGEWP